MTRAALIAIAALFIGRDLSHGPPLPAGPPHVKISTLLAHARDFDNVPVIVSACSWTTPYDGSGMRDGSGGVATVGGADIHLPADFDWMTQEVCGTFLGRLRWNPSEEPLKYLCTTCFDIDKTLRYRVVTSPPARPSPPSP